MIYCTAPYISWALVFQSIPADMHDLDAHAPFCYAQEVTCGMAADAANHAFTLDGFGKVRFAKCEMQPAAKDK